MPGTLPPRTADTMSRAVAMSSPSGRMSKRARATAEKRLREALFGDWTPDPLPQPSELDRLRQQAKTLRDLIGRGMTARKYVREAERCEAEIARLEGANA